MRSYTEKITKYYKYNDTEWEKPVLSSNGVFYKDKMAIDIILPTPSKNCYNYGGPTAYSIFAPNTGFAGFYCNEYRDSMQVLMYFPKPLKMTSFGFSIIGTGDDADGHADNVRLYGGNTKYTCSDLIYFFGYDTFGGDVIIENSNYYQCYSLYLENGGVGRNDKVTISNIRYSGIIREIVETDESDYDLKNDYTKIYCLKKNKYQAFKSYKKGQYLL